MVSIISKSVETLNKTFTIPDNDSLSGSESIYLDEVSGFTVTDPDFSQFTYVDLLGIGLTFDRDFPIRGSYSRVGNFFVRFDFTVGSTKLLTQFEVEPFSFGPLTDDQTVIDRLNLNNEIGFAPADLYSGQGPEFSNITLGITRLQNKTVDNGDGTAITINADIDFFVYGRQP